MPAEVERVGFCRPLTNAIQLLGDALPAATAATTVAPVTVAAPATTTTIAALLGAEAVRAVDRLVPPRLERHPCLLAARGTGGAEHLPRPAAVAATTTAAIGAFAPLRATRCPAVRTAARLVREALLRVVRLVVRAEGKGRATIGARQGSVGVSHSTTSKKKWATFGHRVRIRAQQPGPGSL